MATKVSKKKEAAAAEACPVEETKVKKSVAKKKTTSKKATAKKSTTEVKKEVAPKTVSNANPNAYLVIDYPVEAEQINSNHYAIRLGASPDGYVELSFNDGEWNPCRYADGYWWFDWVYFNPGNYKLAARMVGNNGETVAKTGTRKCKAC